MTLLSRRDVLMAGFTVGAGLSFVQAAHPKTLTTVPSQLSLVSVKEIHADKLKELHALRGYRRWMQANLEPQIAAISVPFATIPVTFYTRVTEKMLASPEPNISHLHHYMTVYGETGLPQKAVRDLFVSPKGIDVVTEIDLELHGVKIKPVRVVTPRYLIDIEEPNFSMRHTARILIEAAEGLSQECAHIVKPMNGFKGRKGQITQPKVSVILEGFMLQVMAWVNIAAYAEARKLS